MDWLKQRDNVRELFKKYRYVLLVFLVGLFLLLLPEQPSPGRTETVQIHTPEIRNLEDVLSDLLSQVEGAGKVRVLLTEAQGERRVYQIDQTSDSSDTQENHRQETVIVTDGQRQQTGLLQQVISPQYQGAVVLCQGAGSAAVKLAMIQAVASVTGLPTHQITVLKMK